MCRLWGRKLFFLQKNILQRSTLMKVQRDGACFSSRRSGESVLTKPSSTISPSVGEKGSGMVPVPHGPPFTSALPKHLTVKFSQCLWKATLISETNTASGTRSMPLQHHGLSVLLLLNVTWTRMRRLLLKQRCLTPATGRFSTCVWGRPGGHCSLYGATCTDSSLLKMLLGGDTDSSYQLWFIVWCSIITLGRKRSYS